MNISFDPVPTSPTWSTNEVILQYQARLGLWTNWSRGSVLGQTLTLRRSEGNLLIAFTSVFIGYVGSRLWQVASIALHRCHSTDQPQAAHYHQRQIILRNASSADSAIAELLQLHYAWRRGRRLLWILPTLLTGLFCVLSFFIAGGFSSQIASSLNAEVLLDGSSCGIIDNYSNLLDVTEISSYEGDEISNAINYAQRCYLTDNFNLLDCTSFVEDRTASFADEAAPCPFANNICRSNSSNLILDTGYLDSHHDFGINSPPDQRILFRKVSHCAPLTIEGRATEIHDEILGNMTLFDYGNNTNLDSATALNRNYTYMVSTLESQYEIDEHFINYRLSRSPSEYLVFSVAAVVLNGIVIPEWSDFIPDPDLVRSDADVELIFLSGNGVAFAYPTEDLFYRVKSGFYNFNGYNINDNSTWYSFDVAASPLACAEQFQYCRANENLCGPLASSADAVIGAFEIFGIDSDADINDVFGGVYDTSNNSDASRFQWFSNIMYNSPDIEEITMSMGGLSLASSQTLSNGIQSAQLPQNQWQLDMKYLWATMLSAQQSQFIEVVQGPSSIFPKQLPSNKAQRAMCENQKIQTKDYTSFSFFALLFTFIIGLVIVVISFTLAPFLGCLQKRSGYQRYADLEWTSNYALQLHRLAHENENGQVGIWRNCSENIPTTQSGVLLASLDISDKDKPRLHKECTTPQSMI